VEVGHVQTQPSYEYPSLDQYVREVDKESTTTSGSFGIGYRTGKENTEASSKMLQSVLD
jgi:hypothetical protein